MCGFCLFALQEVTEDKEVEVVNLAGALTCSVVRSVDGDGGGGQKACTESERMTGLAFIVESWLVSDDDFTFQSISAD